MLRSINGQQTIYLAGNLYIFFRKICEFIFFLLLLVVIFVVLTFVIAKRKTTGRLKLHECFNLHKK